MIGAQVVLDDFSSLPPLSLRAAHDRIAHLEQALAQRDAAIGTLRRVAALTTDDSPTIILQLNPNGEIQYANAAATSLQQALPAAARNELQIELQAVAASSQHSDAAQELTLSYADRHFWLVARPVTTGAVGLYLTDCTAQVQATQQIIAQRNFYHRILHELPGDIAIFDEAHRYLFLNPEAIRNPDIRQWIVGKDDFEYCAYRGFDPERAVMRRQYFERALAERRGVGWEEALPSLIPNEEPRFFLRRFFPIFHPDGRLNFVLGYGLNITDRRRAEDQLRESDSRLREQQAFLQLVLDVIPAAVYIRKQGRTIFVNRAMRQLSALTMQQAERISTNPNGQEAREAAHSAKMDALVLATGEMQRSEDSMTLDTGEVRWFQTVKSPFPRPDGTVLVLGASTDITDSKQAQLQLERSEKRYRDLQHYALALIYTHRLDGQFLTVNPACAQLLETPAEVLAAGTLADALPDARRIGQYLRELANSSEARGVARLTASNGQTHFVLYHSHVVHEAGEAPYIIGYGQDITDRVLIEQELKRAKKAAEKAAKARTTFLATMSHEIRTPLNGVLGIATLLAKTQLLPEQQQQVAIIQSSGQHLLAVINDVLDVAKITSGKLELEHAPFNLTESVEQAVAPMVQQAQQRGLEFRMELTALDTPWVLGDALRLNQVILNLLSNAIKFTQQGFVSLSSCLLAHTPETISVEFCIADTGIGIPADKLTHIFESFTQANADTTRRFGGTGLGLNISRALVEQLGGRLMVTSRLGQGSTFTFQVILPRTQAPVSAANELREDSLAGLCVLLVEDNDINRFVARRIIQSWGGRVDEAPDGLVALELFEHNYYDVVLMDIQLPGMNGMEITQCMRQHPDAKRAGIGILALTANAYESDVQQYLAAGMNDTLSKPFDEVELCRKILALHCSLPPTTARI